MRQYLRQNRLSRRYHNLMSVNTLKPKLDVEMVLMRNPARRGKAKNYWMPPEGGGVSIYI